MVPTPINYGANRYPRLTYSLLTLATHGVGKLTGLFNGDVAPRTHSFAKRESDMPRGEFIAFAVLIPVLVLLSGLFAGLTLGYMSLDETQLHVLAVSGTPKQKKYAERILPIRKNGHLLLITLLLANMVVNETLPVISENVLGGGIPSVAISTVLIVIFSEIIPQSLCTRYGLAIGANMAWFVRILIYAIGIVSWPVAKLMELILGPHHGIMYRRGELKELIALHSATGELGGDLQSDTVTIIGATLDLQEKVVKQAMTPLEKTFMLNIDTKLDFETMKRIAELGHSRVPVYEEVDVPVVAKTPVALKSTSFMGSGASTPTKASNDPPLPSQVQKVKKIIGVLLVKQLLLLDPKEATPLRSITLNTIPCVPFNEPILKILDKFQEGRSHMAIVNRFSVEKAKSVQQEVKKGLTQRLKDRVGMGDSSSSDSSSDESADEATTSAGSDRDATLRGDGPDGAKKKKRGWRRRGGKKRKSKDSGKSTGADVELGDLQKEKERQGVVQTSLAMAKSIGREQSLPDDAVLGKEEANDFVQSLDPYIMPLGIITLEDVLEELIGEEIYDEFDAEGQARVAPHLPRLLGRRGRPSRTDASPLAVPRSEPISAPHLSGGDAVPRGAQTTPATPVLAPASVGAIGGGGSLTPTPMSLTPSEGGRKRGLIGKMALFGGVKRANTIDAPPGPRKGAPAPEEKEDANADKGAGSSDAPAGGAVADDKEPFSEPRPEDKNDAPDKE